MIKRDEKTAMPRHAPNIEPALPSSRKTLWGCLLLFCATVVVYLPALSAGFVWDDNMMLTDNALVKEPRGIVSIWFSTALPDYYPLTSSSLWLEWRLWGARPFGYHLVNILFHAGSACLFWRILNALRLPGALLAALVFALHPMNVQSVAWISERKNTLCMFFFLLSVLWYLRSEQLHSKPAEATNKGSTSRWYWLSLLAFLGALLSKTAVVALPIVLLVLVWWKSGEGEGAPNFRKLIVRMSPYFALSLMLGIVTLWFQSHRAIGDDSIRNESLLTRIAAAAQSFWFYLGKILAPIQVSFVYPEWNIHAESLTGWLPLLAIGVLFLTCWFFRRSWGRAALFALSYFLLMLLPILGLVNIYFHRYSLVADHWAYFASLGIIAYVICGGAFVFHRMNNSARWLFPSAAIAAVLFSTGITWSQAGVYRDLPTLWNDTISKNPRCWLAHNNLGQILAGQGRNEEALVHYQRALEAKPDSSEVLNNMAAALLDLHKPSEALRYLNKAVSVDAKSAMAYYNLGLAYDQLNQPSKAEANYRRACDIDPDLYIAQSNLGVLFYSTGRKSEAIEAFKRALKAKPDHSEALNNLGVIYYELRKYAEAESFLREAVRVNPSYSDAFVNLGNVFMATEYYSNAIQAYRRSLELAENVQTRFRLGDALFHLGDNDGALREFTNVLQIVPDSAEVRSRAAEILAHQHRTPEAVAMLRRGLELRPESPELMARLAFVLSTTPNAADRNPTESLTLASRAVELTHQTNSVALDAFAVALADNARFDDAIAASRKAIELSRASGDTNLASAIMERAKLFETRQPYRR